MLKMVTKWGLDVFCYKYVFWLHGIKAGKVLGAQYIQPTGLCVCVGGGTPDPYSIGWDGATGPQNAWGILRVKSGI